MEQFFKAFGESKIPTLLLIGAVLLVGAYIVISSGGLQIVILIGSCVILIGLVLAIISFADYRNKEYTESIIQHYNTALSNISKTHSLFEDSTQKTLKSPTDTIGSEDHGYSLEKGQGTTVT